MRRAGPNKVISLWCVLRDRVITRTVDPRLLQLMLRVRFPNVLENFIVLRSFRLQSLDRATFFRVWFVNAWFVGSGAPTQLVWVAPVILH